MIGLALQDRQSEVSGLLRITVPPSLVEPFFLPAEVAFQARYPNARVAILSTERYVDLLHERIDVAFRISPLKDSQMTTSTIGQPIATLATPSASSSSDSQSGVITATRSRNEPVQIHDARW